MPARAGAKHGADVLEEDRAAEAREKHVNTLLEHLLHSVDAHIDAQEKDIAAKQSLVHACHLGSAEALKLAQPQIESSAFDPSEPFEADAAPTKLLDDPFNTGHAHVTRAPPPTQLDGTDKAYHSSSGTNAAGTASVTTRRSNRSRSTPTANAATSATTRSSTKRSSPGANSASNQRNLASQAQTSRNAEASGTTAVRNRRKQVERHESDTERQLREELASRKQAEAARQQREQEEAEEARKLQAFRKNLRGKDYSYDHRGQIVMLNKVDPSKLPSSTVSVSASVTQSDRTETTGSQSHAASTTKTQTKEPASLKHRVEKPSEYYVPKDMTSQPRLADTIQLAPGVELNEGGTVRKGPPQPKQSTLQPSRPSARQ